MEHKSTREKMADMTTREKFNYIKEYYKFHIIGTLVLIAIVTSFVVEARNKKEPILNVTMMGNYVDNQKLQELQEKATASLIKENPKNKKIVAMDFLITSDNPADQYAYASSQKLMAALAAGDIDILIMDKESFEANGKEGIFLRLDTLPQYSTLNLKDFETLKFSNKENNVEEGIYGISINNSQLFKDLNYETTDKILGIVSNSKNVDKAFEFIQWFISQKGI
jgi:ABC-type glycerol-3-phosphate transport system substrate-binding protein